MSELTERERLVEKKNAVDAELREAKIALMAAKGDAAARGRFMSVEDYTELNLRVARLMRQSQTLQRELSLLKKEDQRHLDRMFIEAMKTRLLPDQWNAVWAEVKEKASNVDPG